MIEVRIGLIDDDERTILGNFDPDQINNVVSVVKDFGICIPEIGRHCTFQDAQFTDYGNKKVVFEIIVD